MRRLFITVGALAFAAAPLMVARAADVTATLEKAATSDANKTAEIGQKAPAWKELEGVDGKKHSLADLKDAKAVVVVFTCNHCPVAKAYEDRLIEFTKEYKDKGVEVVAISVSNGESDRLPAMKERAKEKDFNFAYVCDPSQKIGREFGAAVTPHVFVLDGERKLAYMGAIDDNMRPTDVEKHYLRDAVDAVLAGGEPANAKTKPMGCGIGYE